MPSNSLATSAVRAKGLESSYAWVRLLTGLLIATIGNVGMWSVVVALPAIQAEFGIDRGGASLPYTLTMLGFAFGGIAMGRLADRFGVIAPVLAGTVSLALGYALCARAPSAWTFTLAHGLLIGVGSSALFGPLLADISLWFDRRRGIAVAISACGNYTAGAIWPPLIQHFIQTSGWRATYLGIGLVCLALILPLSLVLARRAPAHGAGSGAVAAGPSRAVPVSPALLQGLVILAGIACCMAMSMPQVHIVAYCGDLGYGRARGAQMLSLMLGLGIVSRIVSGFFFDRIGGLRTLLLGSLLQGLALLLYLPFDSLWSLYVVSGLFGLFQGGIVPSYAIIVRENFPAHEAGTRVGLALMATLIGMALGGWLTGVIFDVTGSYRAAFVHGIGWNLVNLSIVSWLIWRGSGTGGRVAAA